MCFSMEKKKKVETELQFIVNLVGSASQVHVLKPLRFIFYFFTLESRPTGFIDLFDYVKN